MRNYIHFIKKFRLPLFILFIAITITAIIGITRIQINGNFEIFIPTESTSKDLLDEMDQYFESSDQIIYLVEMDSEMTPDSFSRLQSIQSDLSDIDAIGRINGPAPTGIILNGKGVNLKNINHQKLDLLLDYYKNMDILSPIKIHEGITYGVFTLFVNDDFNNESLSQIEPVFESSGFTYYASGNKYMQYKVFDYILDIFRKIPPMALFLILLVFFIQLGNLKGTLLSILPAGIGSLWTLGIVGYLGKEVSIITVLAPIFTIVIGSADGLHFISHVQDEQANASSNEDSLVSTLKLVGLPMIITTVTSMAGFLALLTMNTAAIKDLAIFASVGILIAGIVTWYVLPLILVGDMKLHRRKTKHAFQFTFIKKLWGIPSYLIMLAIIILFTFTLSKINTEFNMLMVYRDYTDIYKSNEKILEVNGGATPVFIYGTLENDPLSPENTTSILNLQDRLNKSDYVGKSLSIYNIISTLQQTLFPGSTGYPTDPEVLAKIDKSISLIPNNPSKEVYSKDNKAVKLVVFPTNLENDTLLGIKNIVDNYNKENSPFNFKTTGIQYMMMDLNQSMFSNQIRSTIIALVLVFVLFLISIRKVIPSLISLLPIIFTTLSLFAFLGFSGISLNILTTTMFSITIGVGIDYAIHFTSVFISMKKEGMDAYAALDQTYKYTSRPIIANAIGLSLGLSALMLSPLQIHLNIAMLMWVTMLVSVFLSLSVLPSILRLSIHPNKNS